MFKSWLLAIQIFMTLAPDDGGAGGGEGGSGGDVTAGDEGNKGGEEGGAGSQPKTHTYLSQASPEIREKYADYFKEYPKINDVLLAHVKAQDRLKRSIVVPDKEKASAEEIKAFYKQMGIPESAEEYEMKYDEKLPEMKEVSKLIGKTALDAGLTKNQGKALWETVAGIVSAGVKEQEDRNKAAEAALPDKLTEMYHGEQEKATEAINLFKALIVRIGNKDVVKTLSSSGLLYNPAFVSSMAQIEAEIGDDTFLQRFTRGDRKGKTQGKMGHYSEEFDTYAGGAE